MWVDIGVNLTDTRLPTSSTVEDARNAGVTEMIITSTDITSLDKAMQCVRDYPNSLRTTAGIHPHYTGQAHLTDLERLRKAVSHEHVIAIGECGLDFNRDFSPRQIQLDWFERHLQLAVETQLPLFLHERDAFDAQYELLSAYAPRLVGGVAHCFTGNIKQMSAYLDLGLYIGVTGWVCDEKRGAELRSAVQKLPLNSVMLESDAPYLFPKSLRPKRRDNTPANLPFIAEQLANLMAVEPDVLARHARQNTYDLFAWPRVDKLS